MKLDQEFWNGLHPNVRLVIKHVAFHPSERNTCYAAGYLRAANEFGGLLYAHYSFLLSVLGDESDLANWRTIVKELHHAA